MCGFVGMVENSKECTMGRVFLGLNAIRHRGPDDSQIVEASEDRCVVLGHARLEIIGLGVMGKQPMWDGSGKVCLVYNGEVYNYKELASQVGFRPLNDTEVVLQAYLKWGTDCFKRFNGMFALAIWDGRKEELILARDRWGIKPLYYTWTKDGAFAFASELKGLVPFLDPDLHKINKDALQHYCLFGYTPIHQSILDHVMKIYPGHCVTWHGSSRGITNDFGNNDDTYTIPRDVDPEEAFRKAIERHLIADVPVGVLLSGGIDSSLITAYASEIHPGIQTFTMGFEEQEQDESKWAKLIAEYLGTTHHEFIITEKDVLDCLDKVVDTFCEPFADSSALPTYLLCNKVSHHVKTCLVGDGGDELFGGYERYRVTEKIWNNRWWVKHLAPFIPGNLGGRFRKLKDVLNSRSHNNLFDLYKHTILYFQDEDIKAVFPDARPITHAIPLKNSVYESLMDYDLKTYLPGDILVKSDRCSMAHGLELRVPFLDNEFAALARGLPAEYRKRKCRLRWMLEKKIPRRLWWRPKQGFGIPLEKWLRGPLKDRTIETLFNPDWNFDRDVVRYYLFDFYNSGNPRHQLKIWNLLMFHLWKERWL